MEQRFHVIATAVYVGLLCDHRSLRPITFLLRLVSDASIQQYTINFLWVLDYTTSLYQWAVETLKKKTSKCKNCTEENRPTLDIVRYRKYVRSAVDNMNL